VNVKRGVKKLEKKRKKSKKEKEKIYIRGVIQ